jgi:CDP-diacylglycerol--glycerol-3-phosphate 3-phosphatidyltransferase
MSVHTAFIVVYIAIGITDVLDGLIARRLGCESDFGAKLDSIADFIFYSIFVFMFLKLYPSILELPHQVALIVIISIRLINMLLTKLKYKRVVFIHTLANKASGVIIYLMPLALLFIQHSFVLWAILIIVFIAAIEELLITVKYTEPDLNRRSIFFK